MAAGPSIADMMANLAFAIGLVAGLARDPVAPESRLPFDHAEANFYAAARHGLDASLRWIDGRQAPAVELLQALVARARSGLDGLGVDAALSGRWLALIEARLAARATGARWQLDHLAAVGGDLAALTLAYAQRQCSGDPVHLWG
jgi:gamma-glutamyl:cysteine ligase YbdK (ATP-grasp superfamily)